MPKASLEFAAKLYDEYCDALGELWGVDDDEIFDDIYDTQNRYDKYVRELATKPEIVNSIPEFARNKAGDQDFINAAWHVVYLSQNTTILDELLSLVLAEDSSWLDSNKMLHLLKDDEADVIINHLKSKDITKFDWLTRISQYIKNNRRKDHLDCFIHDNKLRFLDKYYTEISYFNLPLCVNLIEEQITKDGNILKYKDECLRLQIQKLWRPLTLADNTESYSLLTGEFGGPKDLPNFIFHAIAHLEKIEAEVLPYSKERNELEKRAKQDRVFHSFQLSGNFEAIECLMMWLIGALDDEDDQQRVYIFITLCELVRKEAKKKKTLHPDMKEISKIYRKYRKLYNNWELCYSEEQVYEILAKIFEDKFKPKYSKNLWGKALPIILSNRDPKVRYKYSSNKPFDLLKELKNIRLIEEREQITQFIDKLIIYTGQYFPFDEFAYFDKQQAQLDVWQQYLEENREQFLPGRWVRWGEYID